MAKQIRAYRVEVVHYPTNTYNIYVIGTKTQVEEYCAEHTQYWNETYYNMEDYMVYSHRPFLRWIGCIALNFRSPNSPWYDGPSITVLDERVDLDDCIRVAKILYSEEELR